ncbi:FadR/GntR family transcriptional regulator [Microlunatus soli]|nr:FadR/GntR family transcriptional regulator [Microlunatus soli]
MVSAGLSDAIKEAGLGPGDKIPSERELGEQFGVSRPVVREAIRHLAAKGILEVRTGSGVRVASIGHEAISESIELYLTQRDALDPDKINEVLTSLELRAVELAATLATEDDLERVLASRDALVDLPDEAGNWVAVAEEFHSAIARAGGNEIISALINSLTDVRRGIGQTGVHDQRQSGAVMEQHRRIADALSRHDADAAVAAMTDHLDPSARTSS